MSCIGNSGPILPEMHDVCDQVELASVLSGNRNFEGRISPDVAQNYLMTPAAVIAYAIAGTVDFDMRTIRSDTTQKGDWCTCAIFGPTRKSKSSWQHVNADLYNQGAAGLYEGDEAWRRLSRRKSDLFPWDDSSTYVRERRISMAWSVSQSAGAHIERPRAGAARRFHHD